RQRARRKAPWAARARPERRSRPRADAPPAAALPGRPPPPPAPRSTRRAPLSHRLPPPEESLLRPVDELPEDVVQARRRDEHRLEVESVQVLHHPGQPPLVPLSPRRRLA